MSTVDDSLFGRPIPEQMSALVQQIESLRARAANGELAPERVEVAIERAKKAAANNDFRAAFQHLVAAAWP